MQITFNYEQACKTRLPHTNLYNSLILVGIHMGKIFVSRLITDSDSVHIIAIMCGGHAFGKMASGLDKGDIEYSVLPENSKCIMTTHQTV